MGLRGWLTRWKATHLLGAWGVYWLALAASVLWRPLSLLLGFQSEHGTVSVSGGLTNGDLGVTLALNDAQVWSLNAQVWEWSLWLIGPPLLLWALWIRSRPSVRDQRRAGELAEGTSPAEPIGLSRDRDHAQG